MRGGRLASLFRKAHHGSVVILLCTEDYALPGFADAEDGSCVLQCALNHRCERVCATEHAPRNPFRLLECRHGLADIVQRGGGVLVERRRVIPPYPERNIIRIAENAPRHG